MTSQEPLTPFSANVDEMHETEVIVVSTPAPVFVDSTGRRRRVLRRLAYGFGGLCMLYGGLVSVSLAGGPVSSSAVLPVPDPHRGPEDRVADRSPVPATAPTVTPTPRPLFATEVLPRRPVSVTSSLGPDVPRAPAAARTRTPSAAPARRTPTATGDAPTRPVESAKTPPASPSTTPGPTIQPAPPTSVSPGPPGTGGTGGGTGNSGGTGDSGGAGGAGGGGGGGANTRGGPRSGGHIRADEPAATSISGPAGNPGTAAGSVAGAGEVPA